MRHGVVEACNQGRGVYAVMQCVCTTFPDKAATVAACRAHVSRWIHLGGAVWATLLATRLVRLRVVGLDDLGLVAAYPVFLVYATLALLLMYRP